MPDQIEVDTPEELATPAASEEPREFTLDASAVGGPDKVADGPGVPIAGILILVAMILYTAGHALYGRKKTGEEKK